MRRSLYKRRLIHFRNILLFGHCIRRRDLAGSDETPSSSSDGLFKSLQAKTDHDFVIGHLKPNPRLLFNYFKESILHQQSNFASDRILLDASEGKQHILEHISNPIKIAAKTDGFNALLLGFYRCP
jgi:hypothetical protein